MIGREDIEGCHHNDRTNDDVAASPVQFLSFLSLLADRNVTREATLSIQ